MLKPKILLFLLTIFFLVACGGSEDGDSEINVDESAVSEASVELMAVLLANESDKIPPPELPNPLSSSSGVSALSSDPITLTGTCGGDMNVDIDIPLTGLEPTYPMQTEMHAEFNDYCDYYISPEGTFESIVNGMASAFFYYASESSGYFSILYDLMFDVETDMGDQNFSFYQEVHCDFGTAYLDCSETYLYEFEDGKEFELDDVEVSGNSEDGYSISGVVYDDEGNEYLLDFSGLTGCENGNIGSGGGTLVINDDETIEIDYISCTEYIVTYQGVSETYNY